VSEPRKKRPRLPEDEVIFLEPEGLDEVARALEEAERAVTAVEERHRKHAGDEREASAPAAPAGSESLVATEHASEPRIGELGSQLAEVKQRAIAAEEDAGRMREALLRKSADFENLKRRADKEKTDFFKFALAETFHDLLAVLDNFERALMHADEASHGDFRIGIEMIARQLADVLKKYGVAEVPAKGLSFDPNVHEAVVREETDTASPGTILDVLQKGYVLNDRLLRPARVKVAAQPSPEGS
jgi:molecular chaperone GrpE